MSVSWFVLSYCHLRLHWNNLWLLTVVTNYKTATKRSKKKTSPHHVPLHYIFDCSLCVIGLPSRLLNNQPFIWQFKWMKSMKLLNVSINVFCEYNMWAEGQATTHEAKGKIQIVSQVKNCCCLNIGFATDVMASYEKCMLGLFHVPHTLSEI